MEKKLEELEKLENQSRPKSALQRAREIRTTKTKSETTKSNPRPHQIIPKTKLEALEDSDSDDYEDDMDIDPKAEEIEEIASVDFVAATAKDLKEIDEQTAQNEDNFLSNVKLYKREFISHHSLYRFVDDPLKPCGKQLADYPKQCDKKCLYCHQQVNGTPVFCPLKFDRIRKVFILTRDPFCSREHAKIFIKQRFSSNQWQRLGLLGRFCR